MNLWNKLGADLRNKLGAVLAVVFLSVASAMAQTTPPEVTTPDVTTVTASSLNTFYTDITPIIGYVFTGVLFGITLHFVLRKMHSIGKSA